MARTEITAISPCFIVRHVPTSLAFYRDRLGFKVTFEGPLPDDIFFPRLGPARAGTMSSGGFFLAPPGWEFWKRRVN
jgi:catechol 2,3-dioxygenase-like lactoylglutathione lyase family enzyme